MQYFSFSLTACLFSIFGLVVEREKFGKGDKVMYRSCQHGVSNNLVWLAVCLFQKAGGVL